MPPPRLARRLLAALLPSGHRDDVLANLADLYAIRSARDGRWRAGIWYWRQALTLPARLVGDSATAGLSSGGRLLLVPPVRRWTSEAAGDTWFAARTLARQPGFTLPAVITLAVGIGATLVVFAVAGATVLRPLPYPQPDHLVWLWPDGDFPLTQRQVERLGPALDPGAHLTAMAGRAFVVLGGRTPVEVTGAAVSANHFDVFGVAPAIGRGFNSNDARPGAPPVALISRALWRDAFGRDPAIVGREIRLDVAAAIPMVRGAFTGTPRTIIGVLPDRYAPFGTPLDVVTPLVVDPADPNYANVSELTTVARIDGDAGPQAAGAAIDARIAALADLSPSEPVPPVSPLPLRTALTGDRATTVGLTLGAVLLVLVIACANVAHLSLARLTGRRQELAVRAALGAGRGRLARQLLAENLVVCGLACGLGLAAAWIALPIIGPRLPEGFGGDALAVDARLLASAVAVLFLTTLATGVAPMLRDARRAIGALHAHRVTGADTAGRLVPVHLALVAGEVAVAVIVVSAAGLLWRSFDQLVRVDPGFVADGVVTARLAPSDPKYASVELRRALVDDVLDRVSRLPGVESAGAIHFLPIADGGPAVRVVPDPAKPDEAHGASYRVVTPGYFETMRIPLRRGRALSETDDPSGTPVILVNERMAATFWPGADPIGRRLYRTNGTYWTIVGVVGDVRQGALGLPADPEMYLPLAQSAWASAMSIVARASGTATGIGTRIEDVVHDLDPGIPVMRVAAMTDLVGRSVDEPRVVSTVFALFGVLAAGLGAIGVYGVAAHQVGRRRREIGIRLALGATRARVLGGEIRRGGVAVAVGLAAGAAGSWAFAGALGGMLYEVAPRDTRVLAITVALLGAIALAAIVVPARRASGVDPVSVIRE
ncbi:MAG: ADOP family duplicated permease [Vicinamibacterales bacterium]